MNTESETIPQSHNPFSLFLNIWTSPVSAFVELKPKPRLWYPLLAIIILQIAVTVYYSMSADFDWVLDQTLSASGREFTPEQREAMERMQGGMGANISAIAGSIGILIVVPLIFSILAGYYTIISSFTADGIKFGQWFGLLCWSSTPMLFAALASLVSIFLNSNGQIMQNQLNPLTLNNLVFHYKFGEPGTTFLSAIDLTMLWSVALNVIGYKTWTGKSTPSAAAIACAPYLVIYGVFAFFSFG